MPDAHQPLIDMLRATRIDLEKSRNEILALHDIYIRDLESTELSDDAISAINTSIRSMVGALDKIASEIHRQLCKSMRGSLDQHGLVVTSAMHIPS